ncbi:MAG: pitrilysin family protein [Chloroflexota bacterium]
MDQVIHTRLDNGLTVVVQEMHHAPVAAAWVFYRVGSRNEVPGITGISHWTEHMMFKGTPTFPNEIMNRAISRVGGQWNAYTFFDFTAYNETVPADEIDLCLNLEADRMVNSLFDVDEVLAERTVIISERQGSENHPPFLIAEEVRAAAFRVHPYHHMVIGDMADLENMSQDDLLAHYQCFYHPGNAIVVVTGDVDGNAIVERVRKQFESIPERPLPPAVVRQEPPQRGERRVQVHGEGETDYLYASYRAPNAVHADFFALAVLMSSMLGSGAMGLLQGTSSNKSSRLYKALVEKELAAGVGGGLIPMVDPTLFTIAAPARSGVPLEKLERALDDTIAKLRNDSPVTQAELDSAKKRARASFAFSSESVTDRGFWLGFSELVAGSYQWFFRYLEELERVTLDDIARVSETYLDPSQRTIGWYVANSQSALEVEA